MRVAGEIESEIKDTEARLERLRALYDQWFQGIERAEPTVARKDLDRRMHRLRTKRIRNTALRFRFHNLWQRYVTLQTYWRRIARQIEEGTYRRDVMRARQRREERRRQQRAMQETRQQPAEVEVDLDFEDTDVDREMQAALVSAEEGHAQQQASSASSRAGASAHEEGNEQTRRMPAAAQGGARRGSSEATGVRRAAAQGNGNANGGNAEVDDARLQQLYQKYLEARRRNNERTDNVKYESVAKTVRNQIPKLREKHKGKQIDFEVVVKDGKVGIKPFTR